MVNRTSKWRRVLFVALLVSMFARLVTGAPEAQVNFMALIFDSGSSQNLVQDTSQDLTTISGPTIVDRSNATSTPPKSAEYKLYKKYVQPDEGFEISQNFAYAAQQIFISIQNTSYYIKDLTLQSLNSNSPPAPASTLLFIVLMCLFIIRIGVFGNYGEKKNIRNRRFSLQ